MVAQSLRQRLTHEHRRIDAAVVAITRGEHDTQSLGAAMELLAQHIYQEEVIVFPPLEQAGFAGPVAVMHEEHGWMWPLLERLHLACNAHASADTMMADLDKLRGLLELHNLKEEELLYAAADRLDARREGMALADALERARMPVGWSCAMAPAR